MTSANEIQVGGSHYRGKYQHWDWISETQMGYLEGCTTKYISRWRDKNGLEDLEKSRHYVMKLVELANKGFMNKSLAAVPFGAFVEYCDGLTGKFIESGSYDSSQKQLFYMLCKWKTPENLRNTLEFLGLYIVNAQKAQEWGVTVDGIWPAKPKPTASETLPDAAGGTVGQAAASSTSRDVVRCPSCNGTGFGLMTYHGAEPCPVCGGRKVVPNYLRDLEGATTDATDPGPFGYDGDG